MRYCITPAPRRRATMPTARRIATPTNSARMVSSPPTSTTPSSKAGSTTWSVDQPRTHASATVSAPNRRLPSVESVKIHGSRRVATPSTAKPSRNVPRWSEVSRDAGLLTTPTLRSAYADSGPNRTRGAVPDGTTGGRGPAHAERRVDGQGPRGAPAGARTQPGGARHRRLAPGRAHRAGVPAGRTPGLHGARGQASRRPAPPVAVLTAQGRRPPEWLGVLRAPRGHPARAADLGPPGAAGGGRADPVVDAQDGREA